MTASHRLRIAAAALLALLSALGPTPAATNAALVPTISSIVAGHRSNCAITTGGVLMCWGYGRLGELGTGTTTTSLRPVNVVGLGTGVSSVSVGGSHACAVKGGRAQCWGFNFNGQVGNGTTATSLVPVDVVGLGSDVSAIAAGGATTCALKRGGVKCWGHNFWGQVGDGTTTNRLTPVDVSGLTSGVASIAAGGGQTCALLFSGGVKCWGFDSSGRLGSGPIKTNTIPVDVTGLTSGVTAIAAGGSHTCALLTSGGVKCWGDNGFGRLGNGSVTAASDPVDVVGLSTGVNALAAGGAHTCALLRSGAVKCWGANPYGALGNGSLMPSSVPVSVVGLAGRVVGIAAGGDVSCALVEGSVRCWGDGQYGQLGNGTRRFSTLPVEVDFTTYQTIVLRASAPAGNLRAGSSVTFSATVRPVSAGGVSATVRYEIYREDNDVWRLAARRDVAADATGRATLRWTFVTLGDRFVRARALGNAMYGASPWSAQVNLTVR